MKGNKSDKIHKYKETPFNIISFKSLMRELSILRSKGYYRWIRKTIKAQEKKRNNLRDYVISADKATGKDFSCYTEIYCNLKTGEKQIRKVEVF